MINRKQLFLAMLLVPCIAFAGGATKKEKEDDADEAKQPLQELFSSETVYPQEKNEAQLTLLPQWRKEADARFAAIPFGIEYGITDQFQIGAEFITWQRRNPILDDEISTHGIGDLEISARYAWMHINNSLYSSAIGAGISFPTGNINKELTEGFREYELFAIFTRDFPSKDQGQIFLQTGFQFVDRAKTKSVIPVADDDEEELFESDELEPAAHEFFINTGVFAKISENVVGSAELSWATNRWNHHGEEASLFFTPGLTVTTKKGFEFGVGVPIGLGLSSHQYSVIGKIIYEFDVKKG